MTKLTKTEPKSLPIEPTVLTAEEAAKRLGIHLSTLQTIVEQGRLTETEDGFLVEDLDRL